eukprot:scaffold7520_cov21-Tisochrysis_lutea.AAC.2
MVNWADLPRLNEQELEECRQAFMLFDKDGSGTIDVSELKSVLVALNQSPSDEEVFVMISQPLPVSLIRELDARCRTASFA